MLRSIIVQARMTSTRLPGKVLADLEGRPLLERQLDRLRHCDHADELIVATTVNADDDPVVALADRVGARWFRGPEHDVLARYAGAAREAGADLVVRVTSDCPLIDPEQTDAVIAALERRRADADYASNFLERHLPRGLDTEALWRDVLERTDRMATSPPAREHVTYHIHTERPELYTQVAVRGPVEAADLRWTVDTPEDLEAVRAIYAAFGPEPHPLAEVVAWVREHPEVAALNAAIEQKRR